MKMQLHHRHGHSPKFVEGLIQTRVERIASRRPITEAIVRVEENFHLSPPFTVFVHLTTPGPDLVVQASDYSIVAAVLKVERELHACLDEREQKSARRLRRRALRFGPGRASQSPG